MCNTSSLSTSSHRYPAVIWIQPVSPTLPTMTWMKGLDLNAFSAFLWSLATQYKVTDVTDVDVKDIALSRVPKIGLLKIKMLPTSKDLLFNQWIYLFFFLPKHVLFLPKYNCMLLQDVLIQTFVRCVMGIGPWGYLCHLVVDRYGIFQTSCVGFTVAATPVVLCWPGCRLPAESVWCLLLKSLSKASSRKSNNFGKSGLRVCACLSMLELRF